MFCTFDGQANRMEIQIPKIKDFKPVDFPDYDEIRLDNGIPVYILKSTGYEVIKMEISFRAGRIFESHQGVARACAYQLKEGSTHFDSARMAEETDFYGASISSTASMDFARIELYTLKKYFGTLMPMIDDMIHSPLFDEKELSNYRQRNIQHLQIDLAKNDVLSYRLFTEALFGKQHPYGYNSEKETYENLTPTLLRQHFDAHIFRNINSIILAGGIDDAILNYLNESFGQELLKETVPNRRFDVNPDKQLYLHRDGPQKYQASLRTGRRLFDRNHPDYPSIYVLNTLLGGFFGSRLMKNIREDKGLTYDIYSTVDMLLLDGFLMIGAEVDNENVALTLEEIRREFEILRKTPIEEGELTLVKNYINGNLLNLMNGPFNSIELMRLIAIYQQDKAFFEYFMKQIHQIDAGKLQHMAEKYLNFDDFLTVVVGK